MSEPLSKSDQVQLIERFVREARFCTRGVDLDTLWGWIITPVESQLCDDVLSELHGYYRLKVATLISSPD